MKITSFLLPATLALTLGAASVAPQAQAQPFERDGAGWSDNDDRGWFGERERRERFDRGYEQGRMDERRDRMRRGYRDDDYREYGDREDRRAYGEREGYREYGERRGDRDDDWFGGLFD